MNKKLKIALVSSVAAVSLATAAHATKVNIDADLRILSDVTVTEIQPLSFGKIVAIDSNFDGAATLVQAVDGSTNSPVIYGPAGKEHTIVQTEAGQPGIFEVDLGIPNVTLSVTAGTLVDLTQGGDTLSLSNVVFEPTQSKDAGVFNTDDGGVLRFASGASISTTTGSKTVNDGALATNAYADGLYTGSYTVTVQF